MHRRTGRREMWTLVARRTIALFLVGVTAWGLWLTADFRAVGNAVQSLGRNAELAVALLTAELGEPAGEDALAGMSGWDRLVLGQSAFLMGGTETVAVLAAGDLAEQPADVQPQPSEDPEDAAEVLTTSAPEDIVERTLTAGSSERYVSSDGVYLYNYTNYEVELAELTLPELELNTAGPQILIVHTHTTEAYTPDGTDIYTGSGDSRTTDNYYNMVRVGEEVAQILREAGWSVVHDTEYYDYPAYNGAYTRSGAAVEAWLEKYPTIQVVLDVHRDALVAEDGTVYKTTAEVDGEKMAQVMLVVGSDAGGQKHEHWRKNLAVAVAVQSGLNADYPTLARPMILRSSRFNQQLAPAALLVEIGSHGNTLQEALAAARVFAQSFAETLDGLAGIVG